jgi:hypothetical protein
VVDTGGVLQDYYENIVTFAHTPTFTRAAARLDVQIDFNDADLGPPASANFPRLGTVTLINGLDGSPL